MIFDLWLTYVQEQDKNVLIKGNLNHRWQFLFLEIASWLGITEGKTKIFQNEDCLIIVSCSTQPQKKALSRKPVHLQALSQNKIGRQAKVGSKTEKQDFLNVVSATNIFCR